jgi:hypothetical protein
MPIGIVIPVSTAEPMFTLYFDGLDDYQQIINGYIEPVDLALPEPSTMFVDEEGLNKQLDFNSRATLIAMVLNPTMLYHGANLLGTAVIVGQPDGEGETQSVPDSLIDLLLHTPEYKIEVQTTDDPEAWNTNQRRFTSFPDACDHAINLAYKWTAVERIRVVAA